MVCLGGASFSNVSFSNGLATATAHARYGRHTNHHGDGQHAWYRNRRDQWFDHGPLAAAAAKLVVSPSSTSLSVGQTSSVTVTAEDGFNNVVAGFSDSVTLTDSLGKATFASPSFVSGKATVTATLDAVDENDHCHRLDDRHHRWHFNYDHRLHGGAVAKLVLSVLPSTLTTGGTTNISITAEDAFNDVVTGYSDSVTLADSSAAQLLGQSCHVLRWRPGPMVTATLTNAGPQSITASDTAATVSGTSGSISVSAATNAAFTPGNIAVLELGATTDNTTGSILELVHGQPESCADRQHPVNGGAPLRFSDSGTSGYLSDSSDGTLLTMAAYNTTNNSITDLSNLTTANVRAVATLSAGGILAIPTTYTEATAGDQARSATTTNDTNFAITDKAGRFTNVRHQPQPHDQHSEHPGVWRHRVCQFHEGRRLSQPFRGRQREQP